jgi:5-methylcytosine rRNA methyltransferase NSUN4
MSPSKSINQIKQIKGKEALLAHFSSVYADRWSLLWQALNQPEQQVARKNKFTNEILESLAPSSISGCFQWDGRELQRDDSGLLHFYVMDPASVLCARALQVEDGNLVLDMCAAPGGKTLILTEALKTSGEIFANEISAGRRERLKKVIQQYVPRDIRERVWVTAKEGGLYAKSHKDHFDRVLVDAPCSGERHLLQSPKDLQDWTLKRSEKLAQRQYALMTAALLVTKPGGRIVFSTCSISPLENDGVIDRLLQKKSEMFKVVEFSGELLGEKTKYGQQYFPDQFGFGPIYFSVLEKA